MKSWPLVQFGDIARIVRRPVEIDPEASYPELGIRSFGKGTFHKPSLSGMEVGSKRLFKIEAGDLLFSNVFAWEGAVAVATSLDNGRFGSHRFISCLLDSERALPSFVCRYLVTPDGLAQLQKASPGGAGRNRTLGLDKLVKIKVPLPPPSEQQAIVARLDALADKARQVTDHLDAIESDADRLLAVCFRDVITSAPYRPMSEVAPLVRREVIIDPEVTYRELGIRSFFKGTFHRRTNLGSEYTWQDLYRIKAGDLIFSNIMAWEKAIAVAEIADDDSVGNHRMLTCEANEQIALPGFLWYYFTTPEGFAKIEAASPGTAARNKTLKAPDLMAIQVPLPSLTTQRAFEALQSKVANLKAQHAAIRQANRALVPATLERIFSLESHRHG